MFPAQPDSAQNPGTPLPLLGCEVWHPSGRRLGATIAFSPELVIIPSTPSPTPNLFLLFIPHGQGMSSTGSSTLPSGQQAGCVLEGLVWG